MNLMNKSLIVAAMVAATATATAEVVPVSERVARDNAGLGVRAGGFLVTPKVDVEVLHNDNIYATQNNAKSDFITTVRPEVAVRSNWNRHALNALARAEVNKYADKNTENHNNYLFAMDGRVDVMRDTAIGGGVSMVTNHEDRGNPNAVGAGAEPTKYTTQTAKLGAYRKLGRVNARVDGQARDIDFKNGYTSAGGTVNSSLRDRTEYDTSVRVGYAATDITEVYVKAGVDTRAYNSKGGATVNRSNHGRHMVVGATHELTGKTKADVFVGSERRNYVDPSLKDVTKPTFGANVLWNATDLTSVMGGIERGIKETTIGTSSGYVNTTYKVGVEHAVMRNALLNAGVSFANNDYQGNAANQREDDILELTVGGKYHFNRHLSAGLGYTYRDRDSNVVGGNFDRNSVMLKLTGTY